MHHIYQRVLLIVVQSNAKGVTIGSGDGQPAWHAPGSAKVKKVTPKTCSPMGTLSGGKQKR